MNPVKLRIWQYCMELILQKNKKLQVTTNEFEVAHRMPFMTQTNDTQIESILLYIILLQLVVLDQ